MEKVGLKDLAPNWESIGKPLKRPLKEVILLSLNIRILVLIYLLIDGISDNRDGTMSIIPSNLLISGTAGNVNNILNPGSYSVTFNFSDIAHNYLDGVIVNLDITA